MWGRKKTEQQGGPPFTALADNLHGISLNDPAFPSFPAPAFGSMSMSLEAAPSLRETVKKRLLNDMIRGFANEPSGVVMLTDTFTLRVLSSVCKLSELHDENILNVENITMKKPGPNSTDEYLQRQPLPVRVRPRTAARAAAAAEKNLRLARRAPPFARQTLPALYFLQPNLESVNRLIADFKNKRQPMYASCHLYFSSRLPDVLLTKIKNSNVISKVASFKEINLELACSALPETIPPPPAREARMDTARPRTACMLPGLPPPPPPAPPPAPPPPKARGVRRRSCVLAHPPRTARDWRQPRPTRLCWTRPALCPPSSLRTTSPPPPRPRCRSSIAWPACSPRCALHAAGLCGARTSSPQP
jgi:hypothetical protein